MAIIPLPTSAKVAQENPGLYEALADISQQATPQPPPTGPKVGYATVIRGKVTFHQAQANKT